MCGSAMTSMDVPGAMWFLPGAFFLIMLVGGLLAVALVMGARRQPAPAALPVGDDPLAVASERYVRGEIDKAEFDRILDALLRSEQPGGR
jgi:uncharacterized membrane protein